VVQKEIPGYCFARAFEIAFSFLRVRFKKPISVGIKRIAPIVRASLLQKHESRTFLKAFLDIIADS
jgi:hypothetical protein